MKKMTISKGVFLPFVLLVMFRIQAAGVPSLLPAGAAPAQPKGSAFGPVERQRLEEARKFLDESRQMKRTVQRAGGDVQGAVQALKSFSFSKAVNTDSRPEFTEEDSAALDRLYLHVMEQKQSTEQMLGALKTGNINAVNEQLKKDTGVDLTGGESVDGVPAA